MSLSSRSTLLLAAIALTACPPSAGNKPVGKDGCTRVGQSCEYSPGKLGACVEKDNCPAGGCFVCQSQH